MMHQVLKAAGTPEGEVMFAQYTFDLADGQQMVMKTGRALKKEELDGAVGSITSQLGCGRRNLELPSKMMKDFNVISLTVRKGLIGPTQEEGYLTDVYQKIADQKLERVVADMAQGLINNKPLPLANKYPPEAYFIAMVEYVKFIEAKHTVTTSGLSALKYYLFILKKLLDDELPMQITPVHKIAAACDVIDRVEKLSDGGFSWSGPVGKANFIIASIFWLSDRLGLYELFSKDFANNLTECMDGVFHHMIELGAGRGMLSSALKDVGTKVAYVSDLHPPRTTWRGIKVNRKSAEEVVGKYQNIYNKILFLGAAFPIDALISLIISNKRLFMLQAGFHYPVQLRDLHTRFKALDLSIPGYAGHYRQYGVRLLAINIPDQECREVFAKIPEKFRE